MTKTYYVRVLTVVFKKSSFLLYVPTHYGKKDDGILCFSIFQAVCVLWEVRVCDFLDTLAR